MEQQVAMTTPRHSDEQDTEESSRARLEYGMAAHDPDGMMDRGDSTAMDTQDVAGQGEPDAGAIHSPAGRCVVPVGSLASAATAARGLGPSSRETQSSHPMQHQQLQAHMAGPSSFQGGQDNGLLSGHQNHQMFSMQHQSGMQPDAGLPPVANVTRRVMYSSIQSLGANVNIASPSLGIVKHRSKKNATIVLSPAHLIHVPRTFLQEHYDLEMVLKEGLRVQIDAGGTLDPDVVETTVANYQNKSGYSYHRLLGFKTVCRKYLNWRVIGWQAVDARTVRLCISPPGTEQPAGSGAGPSSDPASYIGQHHALDGSPEFIRRPTVKLPRGRGGSSLGAGSRGGSGPSSANQSAMHRDLSGYAPASGAGPLSEPVEGFYGGAGMVSERANSLSNVSGQALQQGNQVVGLASWPQQQQQDNGVVYWSTDASSPAMQQQQPARARANVTISRMDRSMQLAPSSALSAPHSAPLQAFGAAEPQAPARWSEQFMTVDSVSGQPQPVHQQQQLRLPTEHTQSWQLQVQQPTSSQNDVSMGMQQQQQLPSPQSLYQPAPISGSSSTSAPAPGTAYLATNSAGQTMCVINGPEGQLMALPIVQPPPPPQQQAGNSLPELQQQIQQLQQLLQQATAQPQQQSVPVQQMSMQQQIQQLGIMHQQQQLNQMSQAHNAGTGMAQVHSTTGPSMVVYSMPQQQTAQPQLIMDQGNNVTYLGNAQQGLPGSTITWANTGNVLPGAQGGTVVLNFSPSVSTGGTHGPGSGMTQQMLTQQVQPQQITLQQQQQPMNQQQQQSFVFTTNNAQWCLAPSGPGSGSLQPQQQQASGPVTLMAPSASLQQQATIQYEPGQVGQALSQPGQQQ